MDTYLIVAVQQTTTMSCRGMIRMRLSFSMHFIHIGQKCLEHIQTTEKKKGGGAHQQVETIEINLAESLSRGPPSQGPRQHSVVRTAERRWAGQMAGWYHSPR